jgi:enamine deaminase RidA (YjgF/YER057c/UK114 family)
MSAPVRSGVGSADKPSDRLNALGLTLPAVATPVGSYVPAMRVGDLIYTSGQLPLADGRLATGLVGGPTSQQVATDAARTACLNALAAAADIANGIDAIQGIVRLVIYVASSEGFTEQAAVANGASDLLAEIFGEQGRHIRSAVGVAVLPKNACVEVELVAGL